MYCPNCKCEFRAGFAHCDSCDVALVERLPTESPTIEPLLATGDFVEYCGFLSRDEAGEARHRLAQAHIAAEIDVRDAMDGPGQEFWLRVPRQRLFEVRAILEDGLAVTDDRSTEGFSCSDCGGAIAAADESFCPHCGARFE